MTPDATAQPGRKIVQRFSAPPKVSWRLWRAQPEDRDRVFMASLWLLCVALRVPLPRFGQKDAKDTVPWYALKAEQVSGLRTHFTRTLPAGKARDCMRLLMEGLTVVHEAGRLTDEEWEAIQKAAAMPAVKAATEAGPVRRRVRKMAVGVA